MKSVLLASLFLAASVAAPAASSGPAAPAIVARSFVYEPGPYPSCHASTIVQTTSGDILAAWFGGTGESRPDVAIYLARFENGRWSAGTRVADGVQHASLRYPSWNPVLFQPKNGPLLLFFKVGPSPAKWWGMMMSSTDQGRTWSEPHRLPEGVLGPIKNKPIQLADGTLVCGSSTEDPEPGGTGWRVQIERTHDLGRSWEITGPLNTKAEFNAIQPTFLTHPDGRLQILCRTMEKVAATASSIDGGRSWTKLSASKIYSPNSGFDAVTLADGRHLLVHNYRESTGTDTAENGRCPLNVSLSDDGVTWRMVLTLESEPRSYGYAYPAVIQTRDGLVHITYTWNREKISHVVIDPTHL